MRLDKLHVVNFCQHRDLTVEFPIGITGIIGANGSGKSTIAQALQFAITGESGNPGAKIDDLNWLAAEAGEGGSVEWLFTKNNEQGRLSRAIQRATASLAWGSVKERSVSAVNAEVMKIVGVTEKTLKDIVFVMQGRIERVLFDRPAERKKNFHALFGIDKAEEIREILRKELSKLGVEPDDDRVKQLELRLSGEIDPQLKVLVNRQQELGAALGGLDRDMLQRVITKYDEVRTLQARISTLSDSIRKLDNDVAGLSAQRDEVLRRLETSEADLVARREAVDNLRSKVASIDSAKRLHDTIVKLQADKAAAEQAAQTPNPTPPATGQDEIDAAARTLTEVRSELAPKQAFVRAFESSDGDTRCPTCGQTVPNAGAHAEQLKLEIAQQQAKIQAVEAAVNQATAELRRYESDKQRHADMVDNARKAIAEITANLQNLGPDQYTADAEALAQQAKTTIGDFEQAEQEHAKLAALAPQFEVSIASKSGNLTGLKQQLGELEAALTEAPTDEEYQSAVQQANDIDEMRAEMSNVSGQLQQLQAHRANVLQELEQLKERASGMEAQKRYQALCERARSLFHHDCLPQVATQAYLASLNAHLNKYLQTFQVPFACTIMDDLSVTCLFPGVGARTAERLSGGQKVMLGIAFRFAIYDMFAADLGFMVLDEPTNMLDEDRVAGVAEVLESVRRHAHNTGMQLIVITHERELMKAFDHTIQL